MRRRWLRLVRLRRASPGLVGSYLLRGVGMELESGTLFSDDNEWLRGEVDRLRNVAQGLELQRELDVAVLRARYRAQRLRLIGILRKVVRS